MRLNLGMRFYRWLLAGGFMFTLGTALFAATYEVAPENSQAADSGPGSFFVDVPQRKLFVWDLGGRGQLDEDLVRAGIAIPAGRR